MYLPKPYSRSQLLAKICQNFLQEAGRALRCRVPEVRRKAHVITRGCCSAFRSIMTLASLKCDAAIFLHLGEQRKSVDHGPRTISREPRGRHHSSRRASGRSTRRITLASSSATAPGKRSAISTSRRSQPDHWWRSYSPGMRRDLRVAGSGQHLPPVGGHAQCRLAFALRGRHVLPGVMPAPMMVMKYPHRLGCINSGGISYAWCRRPRQRTGRHRDTGTSCSAGMTSELLGFGFGTSGGTGGGICAAAVVAPSNSAGNTINAIGFDCMASFRPNVPGCISRRPKTGSGGSA